MRTVNPHRAARDASARATLARAEADELRSLLISDAAWRIEAKHAEREQAQQKVAQWTRQLDPFGHQRRSDIPRVGGSSRGL